MKRTSLAKVHIRKMTSECETHHVKVSKLRLLKKSYDDNYDDSS